MAGTSLRQALDVSTMMLVLRQTEFGQWWCVRIGVLVILAVAWSLSVRRSTNDPWQRTETLVAVALAAIYLSTLAFAGHATAATQGASRVMHLASDAMHALAAGAWLGALPALVVLLRSGQPNAILVRGTRLFSVLSITSVSVLLASGGVNAWFLVGSVPGLFGTPYGQLLVVKLALFATMLSIAAVNRWSLTPRLANDDVVAGRRLRRNATLEIFGGILIVLIVGALGTMVPAVHQSPVWPTTTPPLHRMH
jgi:putative copper resistance protein D